MDFMPVTLLLYHSKTSESTSELHKHVHFKWRNKQNKTNKTLKDERACVVVPEPAQAWSDPSPIR
jgi:hypothetical protein